MFMNAPILLGIIAIMFGVAPILMGSNAIYIFLTLCAGEILAGLVASDLTQVASGLVTYDVPKYSIVQLVLLLIVPLVLLMVFKGSIKSTTKRVLQIIPAAASVVIGFMFVVEKMPYDLQQKIIASDLYKIVDPYFGLAVAAGLLGCFLYLWTKRPKPKDEKKKSKK
jgi:hypothetical protein